MNRFGTLILSIHVIQGISRIRVGGTSKDDCFAISQTLHSTDFDLNLVNKRINELRDKEAAFHEDERSDERDILQKSRILKKARASVSEESESALNAQRDLKNAETRAATSHHSVNQTTYLIHSVQSQIRNLTELVEGLETTHERVESFMRKMDLRAQMLVNDIDAENRTLVDARLLLDRRMREVKSLSTALRQEDSNVRADESALDTVKGLERTIDEHLRQSRQDLAQFQQTLFDTNRKRDSQLRVVGKIRMRVDNDRIGLISRQHALQLFKNTTMLQSKEKLAAVQAEELRITAGLARTNEDLSRLSRIMLHNNVTLQSNEVVSLGSLRDSLRESRIFLAKNGYGDRFSLLERGNISATGPTDSTDAELEILEEDSNLLSLQGELRVIRYEGKQSREKLQAALDTVHKMEQEIKLAVKDGSRDELLLGKEQVQLSNITNHTITLARDITDVQIRIDQQMTEATLRREAVGRLTEQRDTTLHKFTALNASFHRAFTAEQEAKLGVAEHSRNLKAQLDEKHNSTASEIASENRLHSLESDITLQKKKIAVLSSTENELLIRLDNQKRANTEAIADVAQISRRLDEKLQRLESFENDLQSEESSIEELKRRFKESLDERTRLSGAISDEIYKREKLESKSREIRKHLIDLGCKM